MELLEIEARKDHLEPGLQSTVSTFSDFSIALLQDFFNTSVVGLAAAIFKQIRTKSTFEHSRRKIQV